MISQVLNRQFVLEQLEDLKAELRKQARGDERRRAGEAQPEGAEELTPQDYEVALQAVTDSLAAEEEESTGQIGFDQPADRRRRGEESAAIDDFSFFSRDPVISNLQSALEEYFETQQPDALGEETGDSGDRRRGDAGPPPAAGRTLKGYQPRRDDSARRVFERFSITDPGWVSSAVAMGVRWFRKKHEFVATPAVSKPIADRTRILMVGDWGSGIPRAQKVADQMRKVLDEGKREGLQQHVVHLGDVYYSGWKREVEKRFLKYWPVRPDEAGEISSWSVNGNHDMYSGGHAYYGTLLADPRFAGHRTPAGKTSSLFGLTNSRWRILGVDSAWEDHDLKHPQPDWIRSEVEAAKRAGQKVMLLSHHQLFSAFEDGGEKMAAALGDLLTAPNIFSWFWGHEHRCAIYKPHMNIQAARLLGHGGVPVYQWQKQDAATPEPAVWEYRGRFKEGLEQWALFGFAALDFIGPAIHVRYINEDGDEQKSETIAQA